MSVLQHEQRIVRRRIGRTAIVDEDRVARAIDIVARRAVPGHPVHGGEAVEGIEIRPVSASRRTRIDVPDQSFDRQRCGGGGGAPVSVAHRILERRRSGVAGRRREGEAAVGVHRNRATGDRDRAAGNGGAVHLRNGQGVAVDIGIVGKHAGGGRIGNRRIAGNARICVRHAHRGDIRRCDGDGHGRRIGQPPVADRIAERIGRGRSRRRSELAVGIVAVIAVRAEGQQGARRQRDLLPDPGCLPVDGRNRQRVAFGVGIVGKDIAGRGGFIVRTAAVGNGDRSIVGTGHGDGQRRGVGAPIAVADRVGGDNVPRLSLAERLVFRVRGVEAVAAVCCQRQSGNRGIESVGQRIAVHIAVIRRDRSGDARIFGHAGTVRDRHGIVVRAGHGNRQGGSGGPPVAIADGIVRHDQPRFADCQVLIGGVRRIEAVAAIGGHRQSCERGVQGVGQRVVFRVGIVRGQRPRNDRPVLGRRSRIGIGDRIVVYRTDGDRDGGRVAVRRAVVRAIGEAVGAAEVRIRRIGETAIRIERERSVGRTRDENCRKAVAFDVRIVRQDAGRRDDERRIFIGRIAVGHRDRRVVRTADGDGQRRGGTAAVPVGNRIGRRDVARLSRRKILIGGVGRIEAVIARAIERQAGNRRDERIGQDIAFDIAVVRRDGPGNDRPVFVRRRTIGHRDRSIVGTGNGDGQRGAGRFAVAVVDGVIRHDLARLPRPQIVVRRSGGIEAVGTIGVQRQPRHRRVERVGQHIAIHIAVVRGDGPGYRGGALGRTCGVGNGYRAVIRTGNGYRQGGGIRPAPPVRCGIGRHDLPRFADGQILIRRVRRVEGVGTVRVQRETGDGGVQRIAERIAVAIGIVGRNRPGDDRPVFRRGGAIGHGDRCAVRPGDRDSQARGRRAAIAVGYGDIGHDLPRFTRCQVAIGRIRRIERVGAVRVDAQTRNRRVERIAQRVAVDIAVVRRQIARNRCRAGPCRSRVGAGNRRIVGAGHRDGEGGGSAAAAAVADRVSRHHVARFAFGQVLVRGNRGVEAVSTVGRQREPGNRLVQREGERVAIGIAVVTRNRSCRSRPILGSGGGVAYCRGGAIGRRRRGRGRGRRGRRRAVGGRTAAARSQAQPDQAGPGQRTDHERGRPAA